jgi:hypothetical protein
MHNGSAGAEIAPAASGNAFSDHQRAGETGDDGEKKRPGLRYR